MQLTFPDDIAQLAESSPGEMKMLLAIKLYEENRIDFATACRLADIDKALLSHELLSRGLSVQQYPPIRSYRMQHRPAS